MRFKNNPIITNSGYPSMLIAFMYGQTGSPGSVIIIHKPMRVASSKALLILSLYWILTDIVSISSYSSTYSLYGNCGLLATTSTQCKEQGIIKVFRTYECVLSSTVSFSSCQRCIARIWSDNHCNLSPLKHQSPETDRLVEYVTQ